MSNIIRFLSCLALCVWVGFGSVPPATAESPAVCLSRNLLAAPGAAAGDQFGTSVSISGSLIAAGAPFDDTADPDAGSAFISQLVSGQLVEMTAASGATGYLGHSVSIRDSAEGFAMVAGAYGVDSEAGAAYLFEKSAPDAPRSLATDSAAGDRFGWAVAIDGDDVVVTAPGAAGPKGDDAGAAYVFDRASGSLQAKLGVQNAAGDRFGAAAAISGDRIAIAALSDGAATGTVYVFERDSRGSWRLTARLVASGSQSDDRFGYSVAISGDRIVVGAPGDDDPGDRAGAIYVFEHAGGSWARTKLYAADGDDGDQFGYSVAVSGDAIVAGAIGAAGPSGTASGAAYRFWKIDTVWVESCKLVGGDVADERFGASVAIETETGDSYMTSYTAVGAPGARLRGVVYVFRTSRHSNGPDPDEPPANPNG